MIISGGENIYPAEVENLINDIDGVSGVAVIGVPDERWGEVPWAVVTVQDAASVDTASVRAHLDGKLARYKLPKNVVIVDELPRTASGKVRKADLRARFSQLSEDCRAIASNSAVDAASNRFASPSTPRRSDRPASPSRGTAAAGGGRCEAARASRPRAWPVPRARCPPPHPPPGRSTSR